MTDVDLDALERDVDAAECLGCVEALALIAELRRLRGQTCETCASHVTTFQGGKLYRGGWCKRWSDKDGGWMVWCEDIGGCCAHEPKADA